jgi:hypothetical protein
VEAIAALRSEIGDHQPEMMLAVIKHRIFPEVRDIANGRQEVDLLRIAEIVNDNI